MPDQPYFAERQTEYWTSREIDTFFLDTQWDVITFPLTQKTETQLPADFVFLDKTRTKIFGAQYKTLYHNAADHWKLDKTQHARLRKRSWMFYFVSELQQANQHRGALHYTRIYKPDFRYREKLFLHQKPNIQQPGYMRWRAFFEGFKRCDFGVVVKDKTELEKLLREHTPRKFYDCDIKRIIDVFVCNLEKRRVLHITGVSEDNFRPDEKTLAEDDPYTADYRDVPNDPKDKE